MVVREPLRVRKFGFLNGDVPTVIFCVKSEHERVGKGPGLTRKIFQVFNSDANFLKHLSVNRGFNRFSRFHKARQRGVKITSSVDVLCQQNLSALVHTDDNAGG